MISTEEKVYIEHLQRVWHAIGDAYASGHIVPSHLELEYVILDDTNLFPELTFISGLCTSNIIR